MEHYRRNRNLVYSDLEIKLMIGPWREGARSMPNHDERRSRLVGTVTATVTDPASGASGRYTYSIAQAEQRSDFAGASSYSSRVLIGNFVDNKHTRSIFSPERHNQGLWCANCFADDIYGNGVGGIQIPAWLAGGMFPRLNLIPHCVCCGTGFLSADEMYPPVGCSPYIFSAIKNPALSAAVEALIIPLGIYTIYRGRGTHMNFTDEQKEAIIAAALAPSRIEALITAHGMEALEAIC
jgi:hypothetical protein